MTTINTMIRSEKDVGINFHTLMYRNDLIHFV